MLNSSPSLLQLIKSKNYLLAITSYMALAQGHYSDGLEFSFKENIVMKPQHFIYENLSCLSS